MIERLRLPGDLLLILLRMSLTNAAIEAVLIEDIQVKNDPGLPRQSIDDGPASPTQDSGMAAVC
jgi:hypothetical protein